MVALGLWGGGWEPRGGPRRTEPGGLGGARLGGARSPEVPRFPVALLSLAREGRGHRGGRRVGQLAPSAGRGGGGVDPKGEVMGRTRGSASQAVRPQAPRHTQAQA